MENKAMSKDQIEAIRKAIADPQMMVDYQGIRVIELFNDGLILRNGEMIELNMVFFDLFEIGRRIEL